MTEAVRASVIVLLIIAAVCLIVLVFRSRSRSKTRSTLQVGQVNPRSVSSMPGGADAQDGETTMRRRFIIFIGAAAAALGALFVKLWSMQVISGEHYSELAEANTITEYTTVAPRGRIYDRNGVELVGNRATFAVLADATVQNNKAVLRKLSAVLGMPRETVTQLAASQNEGAQADRLIALEVPDRAVAYICEHPSAFPGISIESRTVRTYPQGTLACHVLGYAGTISESELETEIDGVTYESGDSVGKDGVEKAFETYLHGDRGVKRVEINAAGDVVSTVDSVDPTQGSDVRLTIDVEVQKVAESALQRALSAAQSSGNKGTAGALVCLDCTNGEVIAMASAPYYDPADFVNGISTDTWEMLTDDDSGYPLSNRCIAGLYPAASTFKGFTGLAGLEYGFASADSYWDCEGTWTGFGDDWPQKCWDTSGHGSINFYNGIVHSCDVVFYEIAKSFYYYDGNETALQDYLKSWGFGSSTGIELSGEQEGRVPTPEWKKEYNRDAPETQSWQPGDLSNLIIGQGDLLVTPLQIACGYAGLATGRVPRPVLLRSVVGSDGETVVVDGAGFQGEGPTPQYAQEHIDLMRQGFRGVVTSGSVTKIFANLGVDTAGKTGTGEVAGKDDFAWYVGYGPYDDPKYVCACLIEEGGAGASVAAPAVRSVLGQVFGQSSDYVSGTSTSER